jgi:hypothetical protein
MVGYWSIIPLVDELFIKDKRGEFFVSEINPYTMPMFITGNTYNIHFSTICLKTKYRKTSVFNKLLFSIIEFIEKLALNGVYINEVVTKASSSNGIALSRGLGLEFLTNHVDGHGEIYWAKIVDLLERPFLRDFEVLRSLYKSKA